MTAEQKETKFERRQRLAKVNPYVELVHTKPDQLIVCDGRLFSEKEEDLLSRYLNSYQKVFVEIGSGCGGHLVQSALENPDALFIGFELRFKRAYRTVEKAEKESIKNLLVIKTDAGLIPQIFAEQSLDGIYVLFPDPWSDKNRWRKKRLLKPEFVEALNRLLKKPVGFLRYKTDHALCFKETAAVIKSNPNLQVTLYTEDFEQDKANDLELASQPSSEFELLFRSQKLPIFLIQANSLR